jgi:hypothetical protein
MRAGVSCLSIPSPSAGPAAGMPRGGSQGGAPYRKNDLYFRRAACDNHQGRRKRDGQAPRDPSLLRRESHARALPILEPEAPPEALIPLSADWFVSLPRHFRPGPGAISSQPHMPDNASATPVTASREMAGKAASTARASGCPDRVRTRRSPKRLVMITVRSGRAGRRDQLGVMPPGEAGTGAGAGTAGRSAYFSSAYGGQW